MDLKALGFDVAEGVNEPYLPGDCGIFVTKVDKGSIVDGRLRYGFTLEGMSFVNHKQNIEHTAKSSVLTISFFIIDHVYLINIDKEIALTRPIPKIFR